MIFTEELIKELKDKYDEWDQGIYKEPSCIDIDIKDWVIYRRVETGGYSGGNCWNDNRPRYYAEEYDTDFKLLKEILYQIKPDITLKQFDEISECVRDNTNTEYEYYGNSTDYLIQWITLNDIEEILS